MQCRIGDLRSDAMASKGVPRRLDGNDAQGVEACRQWRQCEVELQVFTEREEDAIPLRRAVTNACDDDGVWPTNRESWDDETAFPSRGIERVASRAIHDAHNRAVDELLSISTDEP